MREGSLRFGCKVPTEAVAGAREPLKRTYELCQLAEEVGFDFVYLPHHRFTPGYPSAPFVVFGAIAARTSNLSMLTGIYLLPLDHPLDVAEQVATLDELSGGRAILGAGIGYRPYEYDAVGVPFDEREPRIREAIEILRLVWTAAPASYEGRFFSFEDVTLLPRPVQQPHPPIWVGAQLSRGVERAALLGDGWLADFMQTMAALEPRVRLFRETSAANGRDPSICLMRHVGIDTNVEELERTYFPWVLDFYLGYWRAGARWGDDDEVAARASAGEHVTMEEFARDRLVVGTPEDCIRGIAEARDAVGCDSMIVEMGFDQPGYEDKLRLFGREVIPAFR
jgi:probable F420-dependent oxidoreductase